MRKIVYYVATSIDGFICGPNDSIDKFVQMGDGIDQYQKDLQEYDTVIMGRKTYEFGYKYGIKPGEKAYKHMNHYIFSNTLNFNTADKMVHIKKIDIENVIKLKNEKGSDIYLCGGGQFAGWLLDHQLIDILKIKYNPFIMGKGKKLFGDSIKKYPLKLLSSQKYNDGLQIMTYNILY